MMKIDHLSTYYVKLFAAAAVVVVLCVMYLASKVVANDENQLL